MADSELSPTLAPQTTFPGDERNVIEVPPVRSTSLNTALFLISESTSEAQNSNVTNNLDTNLQVPSSHVSMTNMHYQHEETVSSFTGTSMDSLALTTTTYMSGSQASMDQLCQSFGLSTLSHFSLGRLTHSSFSSPVSGLVWFLFQQHKYTLLKNTMLNTVLCNFIIL